MPDEQNPTEMTSPAADALPAAGSGTQQASGPVSAATAQPPKSTPAASASPAPKPAAPPPARVAAPEVRKPKQDKPPENDPGIWRISRKSFLKAIDKTAQTADDRPGGSLAVALAAARAGAAGVRVHDVRETVQALEVQAAIEMAAGRG